MTASREHPLARAARGCRRSALAAAVVCAAAAVGPAVASAATGATGTTGSSGATGATGTTGTALAANAVVSSNWAGYAVTGSSGVRNFKHVAASWIQPTAVCTAGSSTYSAFWVGLGGLTQSSNKLEQTGSEADCDANGLAHYFAWYELVPNAPVTLKLTIAAGDSVHASVSVHGAYVTIRVKDETTGQSISKRLHFAHSDLSSAEWIAEAPSNCAQSCRALPLTDFGTIDFSGASVKTGNGRTGAITSPDWADHAIALSDGAGSAGGGRFFGPSGPSEIDTAAPTVLDATGSAFAVDWAQEQQPEGPGGRFFPGASGA